MKSIVSKIAIVLTSTITLLFMSCEVTNEDSAPVNFSPENSTRAAQADNIAEGSFDILESGFVENGNGPNPLRSTSLFTPCTTITVTITGNGGSIILDFGDSCQLNNGAIVSGIINIDFGPVLNGTRTINYAYENYTYNGNGVEGGGEIFRQIANSNGNPQSTVNETITVSFDNTSIAATRIGLRIVEWTEGFASGTWVDNVYEITGNWDTTFTNGFQRAGEVTQALVRKLSCLYLVSGKLVVEQQNFVGEVDWGDGTCDNLATLTINGQTYEIILGN